ncbi:O-antigen ligase family protein [Limoniibacter endophyticus]|uniref:O-antigen polymerase n=1 Tax=Limoniibacter endophyticus TaxID=1565040 RepID=A0A8J3DNY3_9HYPH|nr:O-antigen ligase [Limoniibacter endophyticus]GHC67590.1 O-antigen polymerase [Limoniibacter endophyticus]
MNSIAKPRRINAGRPPLSDATLARIALVVATVLFTVALISVRPFQPAGGDPAVQGGDIMNQLGYGGLGALSIFALMTLANRNALRVIISPWWIVAIAFVLISVTQAIDPAGAMRSAIFTVIAIIIMMTAVSLLEDGNGFATLLSISAFSVLGLSYIGLVLFPYAAIHLGDTYEPQHEGLWRGLFSHKNIAGPVMSFFAFVGVYLMRRGWLWRGSIILILSLLFISHTGSKTTMGLVPLVMILVALPNVLGMRALAVAIIATTLALSALATLGIVFIPALHDLAAQFLPDLTYTGRVTLWAFSGEHVLQRPWTGYGFESFWRTPIVYLADRHFDWAWDIRGIVHGHNGYMDIAVTMGLPALFVSLVVFVAAPLHDYLRTPRYRENIYLADLFMMIVLFALLNALLESFFFRRADPVWLFFIFATFGLRLVARVPMASRLRN